MARWTIYDPVTTTTWTFAMSPSEGGPAGREKPFSYIATTASDGTPIFYGTQEKPREFAFKGVILTRAERDIFNTWFSKTRQLLLTDDLGESYWVYFDKFAPTRKRVANRELKLEYDMHAYVVDIAT